MVKTNENLFPNPPNPKTFYKPENLPEINQRGQENGLPSLSEGGQSVCYLVPKGIAEKICFNCGAIGEGKWINFYDQNNKHSLKWKCKDSREICNLRKQKKKEEETKKIQSKQIDKPETKKKEKAIRTRDYEVFLKEIKKLYALECEKAPLKVKVK